MYSFDNKVDELIKRLIELTRKNWITWVTCIDENNLVYETTLGGYNIEIVEEIDDQQQTQYYLHLADADTYDCLGSVVYKEHSLISKLLGWITPPDYKDFEIALDILLDLEDEVN